MQQFCIKFPVQGVAVVHKTLCQQMFRGEYLIKIEQFNIIFRRKVGDTLLVIFKVETGAWNFFREGIQEFCSNLIIKIPGILPADLKIFVILL